MVIRSNGIRRAIFALTLVAAGLAAGCAYYNTLYNAKARYREADKLQPDRDGTPSRQQMAVYDEVIEKCRKVVDTWPDSRHVDDAMLLMARSYLAQQQYGNCIATLDTLEVRLPRSELIPAAWALKGQAHALEGSHDMAVATLDEYLTAYPKGNQREAALYYMSTSLMQLDRNEEAVSYLNQLNQDFSNSDRTFDAQVSTAEILAEKELYDESLAVYEQLNSRRIPEVFRYRVWMGLAEVYEETGRPLDALGVLEGVDDLTLKPDEEPPALLIKARAYADADSSERSVATYEDVIARFSRGEFAATANFELGEWFEGQDSLARAQQLYEAVPRAYANSEYATEALRRSNNLSQLMRLQAAADENSPEAVAMREFSMAELQLVQFNDADRALVSYQRIVDEFPDSELAPRAAYAVGYIHGVVKGDSAKAREVYNLLRSRYPGTPQAANAADFVLAAGGDVPVPADSLRTIEAPKREAAPSDTTRAVPADTTRTRGAVNAPARRDTTSTRRRSNVPASADTLRAPAMPDTGAAKADTTRSATAATDSATVEPDTASAAADTTSSAPEDSAGADQPRPENAN